MADVTSYLQGLNIPKSAKADAWDAYNSSSDHDSFVQNVGKLSIPKDTKADLYDMRFSGGVQAPPAVPGLDGPLPGVPSASVNMRKMGLPEALFGSNPGVERMAANAPQLNYGQNSIPTAVRGVQELGTSGQRMRGAADVTNAAGDAMSQLMPMGNAATALTRQVVHLVSGIAGGAIGQKVAPTIVKHFGGSQDAQDLAAALGGVAPMAGSIGHAVLSSGGRIGATPGEAAPAPVSEAPATPTPETPSYSGAGRVDPVARPYDEAEYQRRAAAYNATPTTTGTPLGADGTAGVLKPRVKGMLPAPATDLASERLYQRQFMREKGLSGQDVSSMSPEDLRAQYNAWRNPSETPAPSAAAEALPASPQAIQAYHGTEADYSGTPDTSGLGAHFTTDRNMAESYTNNAGDKARVISADLDIRNPLRIEDHGGLHSHAGPATEALVKQGALPASFLDGQADRLMAHYDALKANGASDDEAWKQSNNAQLEQVKNHFKSRGHDGLVYNNTTEGGGDAYVAFDKSQIKPTDQPQAQTPHPVSTDTATPDTGRGVLGLAQDEQSAHSPGANLEDQMRPHIGRIVQMQRMLDSTDTHEALRRGIRSSRNINSPILSGEDRDLLGSVLGEDVGSALTPEQTDRAMSLAGLEEGQRNPKKLNNTHITSETLAKLAEHRDMMVQDLVETKDPERQAKLLAALEPDEKGRARPIMYTSELREKTASPVDADHPEAPFNENTFPHEYPDLTLRNIKALDPKARTMDLGMLTPEEKVKLKAKSTDTAGDMSSDEAQGTFNENTNGMGIDYRQFRKQSDPERQASKRDLYKTAATRKLSQMVQDLRPMAEEHARLRDQNGSSPLAEQLQKLPPAAIRSLPKELRDLAQRPETDIPQTTHSAPAPKPAAEPTPRTEATGTPAPAGPDVPTTKATEVAKEAEASIRKDYPHAVSYIQRVKDVADVHFGEDLEGARDAKAEGLRVLHEGLKSNSPNALKRAFQTARTHEQYGDTYYTGLPLHKLGKLFNPRLSEQEHADSDKFYSEQVARNRDGKSSPLERLMDSLPEQRVSPNVPLQEKIQRAVQRSVNDAKDTATAGSEAVARAKGFVAAMWDNYRRPPEWTDFKKATGEFSGSIQSAAHAAHEYSKRILTAVPDKVRREAMTNYIQAGGDEGKLRTRAEATTDARLKAGYEAATQLTPGEKQIAKDIDKFHQEMFEEGQKSGVLTSAVENYVRQVWKRPNKVTGKLMANLAVQELNTKPGFDRHRVFGSYFEGEQAGFTPADKDVATMTASYHGAMSQALASRTYVKSLMEGKGQDGRPLAELSGAGTKIGDPGDEAYLIHPRSSPADAADYMPLAHPALRNWKWVSPDSEGRPILVQSDMLLHPEVYGHLKNVLGRSAFESSNVGSALLKGSSKVKSTLLSLSPFHQVQLTVHGIEHGVNPITMKDLDLNEPAQKDLVNHGLMVASFNAQSAFAEGTSGGGSLVEKIPGIGSLQHAYHNYLFRDYLPKLKMNMAMDALDRNITRYGDKLSRDQILELTAKQANSAFGGLNYNMMGRNKTLQDVMRLTFLAPDFLEARARFAAQAVKPFNREQTTALLKGALVMYTGARIINSLANNGDAKWDIKDAFSAVVGGKSYSLRSVQGDILEALTDPRKFGSHRLNPVTTRPFLQFVTGRDDFGRKIAMSDVATNTAKNAIPLPLKGPFEHNDQSLLDTILSASGLQTKTYRTPLEEGLREAYFDKHPPTGAMKPEDRAAYTLADRLRTNSISSDEADKAMQHVDQAKLVRILKANPKTNVERYAVGVNDPKILLDLIDKGSIAEQQQILPILANRIKDLPEADQSAALDHLYAVANRVSVPAEATHVFNHQTGGVEEVAR